MVITKLRDFNSVIDPRAYGLYPTPPEDEERKACIEVDPPGFHVRHPPAPHLLTEFITADDSLFQTIHMGPAVVDREKWRLVVTGLVKRPFCISYEQLLQYERASVTSFHECYGSPIKPPIDNLWRVGNVTWSGVRLRDLLALAEPLPEANFVWSEGLDYGSFGGVEGIDRYQKDLPLSKALMPEVLIACQVNGKALNKERGGPVRLVVPGWFGTNSTKWLCKIELGEGRSTGPFTTRWYNEVDPTKNDRSMRPVWNVEVNSMIVKPAAQEIISEACVNIKGWAWSWDGVEKVEVSVDGGETWSSAALRRRKGFEWQGWTLMLLLKDGEHDIMSRATSVGGIQQPLSGRRNHVHEVKFMVKRVIEDTGG